MPEPEPLTVALQTSVRTTLQLDLTKLPWPDDDRFRVRLVFGAHGNFTLQRFKGHAVESTPLEMQVMAGDTLIIED